MSPDLPPLRVLRRPPPARLGHRPGRRRDSRQSPVLRILRPSGRRPTRVGLEVGRPPRGPHCALDRWQEAVQRGRTHQVELRHAAGGRGVPVVPRPGRGGRETGGRRGRWVRDEYGRGRPRRAAVGAREVRQLVRAFVERGVGGRVFGRGRPGGPVREPVVAMFLGDHRGAFTGTDAPGLGSTGTSRPRLAAAVSRSSRAAGRAGGGRGPAAALGRELPAGPTRATNLLPDPDVRAVTVTVEASGDE